MVTFCGITVRIVSSLLATPQVHDDRVGVVKPLLSARHLISTIEICYILDQSLLERAIWIFQHGFNQLLLDLLFTEAEEFGKLIVHYPENLDIGHGKLCLSDK